MKFPIGEKLFREVKVDRATVKEEGRTVELSFSSEEPVERFFGSEILDHGPKSVRLGRLADGGPVLLNHDTGQQVGVVEKISIGGDRKGRATVRFGKSARADEVFKDVLDGIRRNVSVGYAVHKVKHDTEKNEFRAIDWEPLEISMVAVPADMTVGVGREADLKSTTERQKMDQPNNTDAQEIIAIGQRMGKIDEANKAIMDGVGLEDFRAQVLNSFKPSPIVSAAAATEGVIGLSQKEAGQFSVLRALRSLAENGTLAAAPFELECSRAVEKQTGKARTSPGFFIPMDVMVQKPEMKRDISVNSDPSGGYLVGTTQGSMIELLRNAMMVQAMGATILDGLVGDLEIPEQTAAGSAFWLNEGQAPTDSEQTFGQTRLTPKTVGARTPISRRTLIQSSSDVENLVRNDLIAVLALGVDLAAINGPGANGEPKGILNTTGIGAVIAGDPDGATPAWADIVNLEKEVAKDNAAMGSLGYLANSDVVGKLKTVQKGTNLPFIMDGDNRTGDGFQILNGYRCGITNQVPNNLSKGASNAILSALIFGNWADLLIATWGALDVLIDPYTQGASGTLVVRVLRDCDIAIRHPQSFSVMSDIITT